MCDAIYKMMLTLKRGWIQGQVAQRRGGRVGQCRVVSGVESSAMVDPTFINMYIGSVCKAESLGEFNRCVAGLVVPPIDEQWKVMDILRKTSEVTDITGILGPCMNLLVHKRYEEYTDLVNMFIQYHAQLDAIKDMVNDAMPIVGNIMDA